MLASVDESLKRLVAELKNLGIEDNTLIIFTSDNGGLNENTSNYPLLGGKSYAFEAAMRVPFIVKWSAVVKANQTSNYRVIGTDFYPTFLEVAGITPPSNLVLDGESFLPLFKEEEQQPDKRQLVFHYPHYTGNTSPYSSIIDEDFKLIRFYNNEAGEYLLFDLKNDSSEQINLANKKPELVKKLNQKLINRLKGIDAEFPIKNPNFHINDPNLSNLGSNYNKAKSDWNAQLVKLDD